MGENIVSEEKDIIENIEKPSKKSHKKLIIIIVIILILAIIGSVVGYILYRNYQKEQEALLQAAIARVDEVTSENLTAEYNKENTNAPIELSLTTTSIDKIVYKLNEQENYTKYENKLKIEENTKIYIKYINEYDTYSKDDYVIEITNIDKEAPTIASKNISSTNNTLTVAVEAQDNVGVSKIEASIDGENYNEVKDNKYTFEKLSEGTEYTVKLRIKDVSGNITEDEIKGTTNKPVIKTENTNKSNNKTSSKTTNNKTNSSSNNSKKTTTSSSTSTANGEPSKKEKEALANEVAKKIAKEIKNNKSLKTDLDKVNAAARKVASYVVRAEYTSEDPDYQTAYGVLIKGVYTCAGTARTLKLVLKLMGYSANHINEHLYTHQWVELTMDGKKGWADAFPTLYMAGAPQAGYGEYIYK